MMYRRSENSPPPGGLTKNESACLSAMLEQPDGMVLSTTQIASRANLGVSSAGIALARLVERGYVRRIAPTLTTDPVRWVLCDAARAA
jgi:predicted transcriptional regulator